MIKNLTTLRTRLLATVLIFGGWSGAIYADETQYWSNINLSTKINERFSMLGEWTYRYSEDEKVAVTESVRLGFGYKLNEDWTYAFMTENRHTDNEANDELRLLNQVSRPWNYSWGKLSFRVRAENRRFSDSQVWMLRFRALGRVDISEWKVGAVTPIVSSEYIYIANDVGSREAGTVELRNQVGGTFSALGGSMDLTYMDRRLKAPSRSESRYQIASVALKLSF